MSSPAKVEKIITHCVECNYLKQSMTKFSCNHLICKECLCLLLIENEFNYTNLSSDIILRCPECESTVKNPEDAPTLILKKDELKKLLSHNINSPLKCIKHSQDIKWFCEACNEEFCDKCIELDKEHETSQTEIDDIKSDAAEKLLLNQCLNLDQIKEKINENKSKISSEIKESLKQTKEKIKLAITELNNLLIEADKKSKENEKLVSEFFEILNLVYEKYYSMMNSKQLSLQVIKKMSSMKNIININLFQNDDLFEKIDSLNTYIDTNSKKIKETSPLKIELMFKEGLVQTGNCNTFNTGHKQFMTGAILVNHLNNLVTTSTDNSMIIYEKKLGKDNKITFNILKKEIDKKIIGTALLNFSPDLFVVGYDEGLIKIWRNEDFEVDKIFTGHTNQIRKIIKQDDNTIISCSDDTTIRAWSLNSYEADCSYTLTGHEDKINDILLLDLYDNNTLLSVSDDKTIRLWNLEMKECQNAIKTGEDIQTCLGRLSNGKFMVGGEDGSVTVFNIEGLVPILSIKAHSEPVEFLYESPFTGDIITGSQDNLVKIFKVDSGACVKILEGHKNTILNVIQLNENNILTASVDKTIKIWTI
jgi:WD40 repeat protein